MLKEIRFIENIGRFETAKPTYGATFSPCTLVFGENGWGKSTLSDILRSLTSNNPAILAGRTTVDADAPPKAVMRFGTQNAVFENGAWTGPHPRVAVYDSAFINANVFSGDVVSADHLKNQYGIVVGEEGVRRIRRIVQLDEENRIRSAEAEVNADIRAVATPAMTRDDFLALGQRGDIDDAIAAQDARVQQARRARELKAAAEPKLFPVPTETAKLRDLLSSGIDEVAEHALATVRAHITAHEREASEGDSVHESWLEAGMAFLREDQCPFCGQPLTDRTLVEAYKDFFSAAYKKLGASVQKARGTLGRYKAGEFKSAASQVAQQNAGHFQYWREAGKLAPPDVPGMDAIIAQLDGAAVRLDMLFAAKQANLTEALSAAEAEAALAVWDHGRTQLTAVNAKVEAFLAQIKALKDSIDPAALPALENELKALQATKRRHEDDIITLAVRLGECQIKREAIAKEKATLRIELDEHGRTISTELGTAINAYLKRLNAGFRIDYQEPYYRGREPSASYNILIQEVPVSPRSGDLDKPSFRNTLSAGDKSTLALALFLAKVNSDPAVGETIVVLDDPFTSLDSFRRQFTAIEIRRLCGRALQTITLSHDKSFLRLLWDKIDQSTISSLALQTGAPGMTTIAPYDIEAETQPRHVTERMKLEEFIEGEPHN